MTNWTVSFIGDGWALSKTCLGGGDDITCATADIASGSFVLKSDRVKPIGTEKLT